MLSLYRRQGFEFAPVELTLCPDMAKKMTTAIGTTVSPAEYFDYPQGFARVEMPGPQLRPRETPDWKKYFAEPLDPRTSFTAYGVAQEPREGSHHMHRMHHPLATADSLEQLQSYPWPEWDFDTIGPMRHVADQAREVAQVPVFAQMACTVWENAWYIRDMTVLMADMADGDIKAEFILDRVTEDSSRRAAAFARAGADVLCLGDDIGMQSAIMMSREMYREWLLPRLKRVIAAARAEKPDVLVHYHSCGFIEPYIPDLIEAGVDILNPIQPESMDFGKLHALYGGQLSFNGTLGTQTTMPFGSPAAVRKVVLRNLEIAGARGGLMVCPTHVLEPEVPWENVEAYVKACKEFGGI
jgi:uroporphyrinogen decarboxylase